MCDCIDYIFKDMSDMKRDIRRLQRLVKKQQRFNFGVCLFALSVLFYVKANDEDVSKIDKEVKEIKQELEGEL